MNKLFYAISWLTIILALGILLLFFYWYFFPKTPIEFYGNHKIITKEVTGGGYLAYQVDYCKYDGLVPEVSKAFVDGIIYEIPTTVFESYKQGCGSAMVQLYIPRNLPPGSYYIQTTHRYKVNPVKEIDIITVTEQFEVK